MKLWRGIRLGVAAIGVIGGTAWELWRTRNERRIP